MKYKDFETLITKMQETQKRSRALCDLGLDLVNYEDAFYQIIELLIDEAFSDYNKEYQRIMKIKYNNGFRSITS